MRKVRSVALAFLSAGGAAVRPPQPTEKSSNKLINKAIKTRFLAGLFIIRLSPFSDNFFINDKTW